MLNTIDIYAIHSEFAQAAYGDFRNISTQQGFIDALREGGSFTLNQATEFVSRYEIVAHQPNTEIEFGSEGGFSATVFRDKQTDELIFAVRGTEFPNGISLESFVNGGVDLISDIFDIGYDGLAVNQIVDLYNFYLRLSAKAGEPIYQYEYDEIDLGGGLIGALDFDNWEVTTLPSLSEDGPLADKTFTVAGHSLGGHIASAFSRLTPNAVEAVYTYNAPGFDNILPVLENQTESFFQTLHDLELQTTGSSNIETSGFVHQNLFNIVVEADLVSDIGTVAGERIVSFSEPEGVIDTLLEKLIIGGKSHSIASLTDALNVLNLMYQIQPSFTVSEGNLILQSISNIKSDATVLESLLDRFITLLSADETIVDAGDIYTRIQAIKQKVFVNPDALALAPKPNFQNLIITSLTTTNSEGETISLPAATLKAAAETSLAHRYALVQGNPFAITGNNALYDIHNQPDANGVRPLDIYDVNTDTGTLTEKYLIERSNFLELKINLAITDEANPEDSDIYYEDKASGAVITEIDAINSFKQVHTNIIFGDEGVDVIDGGREDDSLYAGAENDLINGGDGNDYIEGNAGNDRLKGGKKSDILLGGTGNDTLIGAVDENDTEDNFQDILYGGKGNDTYYAGNNDIIEDSDGEGRVNFGNNALLQGTRTTDDPANEYTSADGKYIYKLAGTTLTVEDANDASQTITINNFTSGQLGIELVTLNTGSGTLEMTNGNDTASDGYWDDDDDIGTPELDLGDYSIIKGLDGSDTIAAHHDIPGHTILGGDGDDFLYGDEDPATEPNQLPDNIGAYLYGENGNDFIQGSLQADYLDGGEGQDILLARDGFDVAVGGNSNDLIDGGGHNDQLFGGDGNDQLFGDKGSDIIVGGNDGDIIFGDGDIVISNALNAQFSLTNKAPEFLNGQLITDFFSVHSFLFTNINLFLVGQDTYNPNEEALGDDAGEDILLGGAGDDYIRGGQKDDQIEGGSDNDLLEGEEGNDTIRGGSGDDVIYGDINARTYEQATKVRTTAKSIGNGKTEITTSILSADRITEYSASAELINQDGENVTFTIDNERLLVGPEQVTETFWQYQNGKDAGGDDQLFGGDGQDVIHGGVGDDLLDGGLDGVFDLLKGGQDNDTYQYGIGYGLDAIDDEAGSADKITLLSGINEADVELKVIGGDLHIILSQNGNPTGDILIVNSWYQGEGLVETIEFADGTVWDKAFIEERTGVNHDGTQEPTVIQAYFVGKEDADVGLLTPNNDLFYARGGKDRIYGGGGDDRLFGGEGNDELQGNNDNDQLFGEAGDDILYGQLGNDELDGGEGGDSLFGNEGNDTLIGAAGNDNLNGGKRHEYKNKSLPFYVPNRFRTGNYRVDLKAL